MNAPRLILILLVLSGFVFAINVTSCQNIAAPGVYNLTANLVGAPINASPVSGIACIKIASSDVILDCEGYTITNNESGSTIGIVLNGSIDNVTVMDCTGIGGYGRGIVVHDSNDSTFTNNTAFGIPSGGMIWGFYVSGTSSNNSFYGNTAFNITQQGFKVASGTDNVLMGNDVYDSAVGFSINSNNNTIDGNTVNDCASGIEIEGPTDAIVRNNRVWDIGNQGYWSLGGAGNSTFINNTAQNTSIGFEMYGSGNYLADNTAYEMTGFYGNGFHVFGSDNVYENNTAYDNANSGFFIAYTSDVNLSDNLAYGNSEGILVQNVNNTRLLGDRMYDNGYDLYVNGSSAMQFFASNILFDRPAGDLTNFTNLSITDIFAVGAPTVYTVNWSSNSTVPPIPSFEGKLVDISSIVATSPIDTLVWHWTDAESSGFDESSFVILKYNSSWNNEGAALNTGANTLTLTSVNPASDYGVFGNASGAGIPLSSCQLINAPGNYSVTGSFSGTTSNYYYGTYTSCVLINNTQDVVIDCNNYTITETAGGSGAPIAIRNSTNVTIQNCNLSGARGLGFNNASNNIIIDNEFHASWCVSGPGTANRNNNFLRNELHPTGSYGFFGSSEESYYAYNNVYSPGNTGFYVPHENNTYEHNNVFNSGYTGFSIASGGDGHNFTNNTVQNSSDHGFRVQGDNNRFIDNWAVDNGDHGFFIDRGDDNYLEGNTAQYSGQHGFFIDDSPLGGTNNTVQNSVSQHNSGNGFSVLSSSYDQFINCTAYNNTGNGFQLVSTAFTNITDCNATANGLHGISMNYSFYDIVDPSYFCNNNLSGMSVFDATNLTIADSVFCNNSEMGIYINDSENITVDNNSLYENTEEGAEIVDVSIGLTVTDNTAYDNDDIGIYIRNTFYNNGTSQILRNTAYDNYRNGFEFGPLRDSNINDNMAYSNRLNGFRWSNLHNSSWDNNTANSSNESSGFFGSNSAGNTFTDLRAFDNAEHGFRFTAGADSSNLSDSTFGNNNGSGIYVLDSTDNLIEDVLLYNNNADLNVSGTNIQLDINNMIIDDSGSFVNYTNLSLSDNVSSAYSIDWDMQPAALPNGYIPFEGKWVEIENQTSGVSIDLLTWHWTDAEAASYDEDRLEVLMHNGSWNSLNDTPDTGLNQLSLYNLNPASTYGLAQLNISTCMLISSSGSYALTNNVSGAPIDASPVSGTACIKINSSDVLFDCNGFSITNNGTSSARGIVVTGPGVNNVTVQNCPSVSQYYRGVVSNLANNTIFRNITSHNHSQSGFLMWDSTNELFINNTARDNGWNGFVISGEDSRFIDNLAYGNSFEGFVIDDDDNNLTNNTAYDNLDGFKLESGSNGNLLVDNLAYESVNYGFYVLGNSDGNTMRNNTAYNGSRGFYITSSDNNVLVDNTARDNTVHGFMVDSSSNTNLTDNAAYNNQYGYYLVSSPDSHLYGNDAYENSNMGFEITGTSHRTYLEDNLAWDNTARGFSFSSSNNTVYRNNASNSSYPFYFANGDYHNVTENNATNASNSAFTFAISDFNHIEGNIAWDAQYGFYLWSMSDNNTLVNNSGYLNSDYGFYLTNATNNTLMNNRGYNNTVGGFLVISGSNGNDLLGNLAYDNGQNGIIVQNSESNFLANNTAYDNIYGIRLTSFANYNMLFNNTARDNSNRGFYINSNADHNELMENLAYRNSMGYATWTSSDNVTFTNNTAHSNSQYGFYLSATNNSKLYNCYAYNNTNADLEVAVMLDPLDRTLNISNFTIDNPSGGFVNYTSFDINDVAQGLTEYRVAWTSIPAALPSDVDSFENKWLEVDDINGIVSIDEFVWHWTDTEAAAYDETLFEIWKHNGSYSNESTAVLDTVANTLTINNFNPASDYGIVENNITYCMDITSSGLYMLNNDLAGAPINAAPRPGTTCIKISSSDVIVDCMGYTIANNGTAGTTRAILAESNLDNVTVRNCNLEEYTINLEYYRTDDSFIDNVTSSNTTSYGYYILESDNNEITRSVSDNTGSHGFFVSTSTFANLTNNTARSASSSGIYIAPNSHNSTVVDNIMHNCSSNGMYYQASRDGLVTDNVAYESNTGFLIWTNSYGSAFDNVFNNNIAYDNDFDGFSIYVNRNNFTNNTAYNNGRDGFMATFGNNRFVDNTAYGNTQAGFYANLLDDSSISGLTSYSNVVQGIRARDAENNVYLDTMLYNNSRDLEVDNGGGSSYWINMTNTTFREPGGSATNQTRMSMNDSLTAVTTIYQMSWSAQPAALPENYSALAGFVDITEAFGSTTLDSVAFQWYDAESASLDESYFRLLHHDGSWNEVPGQVLDQAGNEITATNVNDFSTYGIVVYNLTNVSTLKLEQSFAVPSQGGIVEFNITVTNTGNVTLDPVPVVDILPSGLTYSNALPAPDNVTGQTISWNNIGPIGPGATEIVMVNATVDYGSSGNLTNYVNVSGTPPLGENVTAEDYENVTVYTANISALKVDMTPVLTSPGGLVQWLINITNTGEVTLDPVEVTDTLPAGFSYDSASPAADSTAGPVVWNNVGPITAGSYAEVWLNTTVASNVSNGTYYNFVDVVGVPPNGDNVTDNDTAMIGIYAPGINVIKSAVYTHVELGQNVTYILNITNTGSIDVNLTVQDILPGNMTFEGMVTPPVSPTINGQTITWDNYMVLPVGASTNITYNASANVTGFFDNNVTVWAVPPNGDNVTDNDTLQVTIFEHSDNDPKPEPNDFTVGFTSDCDGNTVKVIGASPASGFDVTVDRADNLNGVASGVTDSDGEFTFAGCGLELRIIVKKSKYSTETVFKTMIPCVDCELECADDSECEDNEECNQNFCEAITCPCGTIENHECIEYDCCFDSDCEVGQSCIDNICTHECISDSDCDDSKYCEIAEGAEGGSCEDVPGLCGFAENHSWTQYECGDEEGCPDCPERYVCEENACEPVLDLLGPKSGFVGEDVTVSATEAENACVDCPVRILLPDGTSLSGKTDSRGQLKVPLNFEGPYELTLFENGIPVKSIQVNSLAKPVVTPDQPDTQIIDEVASLFLIIMLMLVLAAAVYWRRRKSRKK